MNPSPLQHLTQALSRSSLVRFMEHYAELFPGQHLKDLVVQEIGPHRTIRVADRDIINFGSDSFLGLDQAPRVQGAIVRGLARWGTHNGASRAFASVDANEQAEAKLADWLGTEATLIYPSVSLANLGALPGLLGRQDLLVVDEQAHASIHEGARIAQANGVRVLSFAHADPKSLAGVLDQQTYRCAVVALDGVYSMSGQLPPLAELNEIALARRAVLYVDDAHATGVIGRRGCGTVLDALGGYDNALVVGSLSKGFSCAGGFIGCTHELKRLLKMNSSTYIFGGPVPPPYLEAVCSVCEIMMSDEYEQLKAKLDGNLLQLNRGLEALGLVVMGGRTPITSILVGDEEATLRAGHFLFEQGFYVQSVIFPAVRYHAGVLRIQVNANHLPDSIAALLCAVEALHRRHPLPTAGGHSSSAA
jgi:7-keto-8-aminopelargonate synthetase-like enzyme